MNLKQLPHVLAREILLPYHELTLHVIVAHLLVLRQLAGRDGLQYAAVAAGLSKRGSRGLSRTETCGDGAGRTL